MVKLEKRVVLFAVVRNGQQIISEMLRIDSLPCNLWSCEVRHPVSSKLESVYLHCFHAKYIVLSVEVEFVGNVGFKAFESVVVDVALGEHLLHYFDGGGNVELNLEYSEGKGVVAVDALLVVKDDVVDQLGLLSGPTVILVLLF